MGVGELAAAWVTAAATVVVAVAAWIQLPLISRQVRELSEQIRLSREAEQNAERRLREWETLKACQRYDYDPVLEAAPRRVARASVGGTDYRNPGIEKRDIVTLLNYLDGLAIGIEQGLYLENIVKDHLSVVFDHAVTRGCYVLLRRSGLMESDVPDTRSQALSVGRQRRRMVVGRSLSHADVGDGTAA